MNSKNIMPTPENFVWTPTDIMRELGLGKSIVFKRLSDARLTGQGGQYSTTDVFTAMFGDLKTERTALVRAQKEEQESCSLPSW